MAGKSEIEAGRAYVSLLLKDQAFSKGLTAAGNKLKSFGRGASIFGAAVAGVGATVTAPLLAMVKEFSDFGSTLNDMSARTGLTVESLSELKFAAEQTGTSLEAVEKAVRFMAKNGLDPKQFDAVAAKIAAIEDPSKRAAAAMKAWGRAGTSILPMAMELQALREEARKAGLVMSGDAAKRADALGDAFDKLRAIVKAVRMVIGDALSETVRTAVSSITQLAITVGKWVRDNKELFATLFKVGIALSVAGAAIVAFGGFVALAGFALTGISAVLGVMASMFTALVSPIGLTVAAVSGLAYWFATSTQWGQQMVSSLAGWFGELKDIAVEAFGGIADALAAGNLTLAAEVAWAGIKLAWLKGTDAIRTTWIGFKNVFMQTTTSMVFSAMEAWAKFTSGVETLFVGMKQRIISTVIDIGGFIAKIGKSDQEKGFIDSFTNALQNAQILNTGKELAAIEDQRKKALENLAAARKTAATEQDAATGKQLIEAQKNLKDAEDRLAALGERAAADRKDKELADAQGFKVGKFDQTALSPGKITQKVFGTFSAAAAMAGGTGPKDQAAEELKAQRREDRQRHIEMLRAVRDGGKVGP